MICVVSESRICWSEESEGDSVEVKGGVEKV